MIKRKQGGTHVKSEKNKAKIIFIILVLYFSIGYIPEYENPEVCYNYDLKEVSYSELSYPVYSKYHISSSKNDYEIKLDNNKLHHLEKS